jgi:hypothetical protein
MKSLILYVLCAVMLISHHESGLKLEVGSKIPQRLIPKEPEYIVLPEFLPSMRVEIDGVSYRLAYQKPETIRFIFTSDEKFVTKNNLWVGMCVSIAKEKIGPARGGITRGPKTEDGWVPVIGYRSHIITCRSDADGEPITIHVNDVPVGGSIEARILQFMK